MSKGDQQFGNILLLFGNSTILIKRSRLTAKISITKLVIIENLLEIRRPGIKLRIVFIALVPVNQAGAAAF